MNGTGGQVMHGLEVPSTIKRYLCVECQLFGEYFVNELGAVWYFNIARTENGKETEGLGKLRIALKMKGSAECNKIVECLQLDIVVFIA